MKPYLRIFPVIFAIVAGSQLYSTLHPYSLEWLNFISKPLIIPLLILWFFALSKGVSPRIKGPVVLALMLSWAGDVLLMFQDSDPRFFLAGIASFLLAQISYAFAFSRAAEAREVPLIKRYPLLIGVYLAYGVWVFFTLKPGLGEMELPVLIYTAAILVMGVSALNRFNRVSLNSFRLVLSGSLCFILSDTLLAFNKFAEPFESAGFMVMLTYMFAQLLIVRGMAME